MTATATQTNSLLCDGRGSPPTRRAVYPHQQGREICRDQPGDGEDFFTILREAFDFLYEEGREAPKMMNVGMHLRLLGHPSRASGLARFLDYVKTKRHVWVCRRLDLAKHWLAQHPCEVV